MTKGANRAIHLTYQGESVKIASKVRQNDGDLVIFLHGMGCTKESFDRAFHARGLQPYSICAFDFPGHGMSGRLPRALYSLQSYADITNRIIKTFGSRRTYLVGHSMGGAVGVIASNGKNGIQCLVSVDGNLVAEDCGIASRKIADQPPKIFLNEGFGQFLEKLQSSSRRDDTAWFNWCKNADPHALHQVARSIVEWSDSGKLLELFNSLACKAYLYGGLDDRRYILPQITTTAISAIPDAGHFMMIDNPRRFYETLASVLAATDERDHLG